MDAVGWVTAATALAALALSTIGGALRFEARMTRLETELREARNTVTNHFESRTAQLEKDMSDLKADVRDLLRYVGWYDRRQ